MIGKGLQSVVSKVPAGIRRPVSFVPMTVQRQEMCRGDSSFHGGSPNQKKPQPVPRLPMISTGRRLTHRNRPKLPPSLVMERKVTMGSC